jgi:hypothetical protein
MAKISTYAIDGNPSLSDKVIGTEVANNNETKNYLISDILSLGSTLYTPIAYGSFYDTTTQTATTSTIATMKYNTTVLSQGVSVVNDGLGNPTQITFANAGLYNLQFSAQLQRTSGGSDATISIWFRLNGTDIPASTTHLTLKANTNYVVASWNFFQQVAAGNNVKIMWSHNDSIQILYEAPGVAPVRPSTPSVILTVNRIA